MKIKNYEQVREDIRAFLPQYLTENEITNTNSFHCLSKSHADTSASSGVLADQTHFHCLGCGMTGDIFDACHLIENRTNAGPGFVTDNLIYLAERYGLPIEKTAMSPEEVIELDTFRAYAKATEWFQLQLPSSIVESHIQDRGWITKNIKQSYGIGFCSKISLLTKHLIDLGFSKEFLHDIELSRTDIFNSNNLIFIIKDHYGRPVGFAARNCAWESGKDSKYINTSSAISIYQKGKTFFNLHNALVSVKSGKPLYITEGYPNVISAELAGFSNTCAIGGTALTEDHVLLLRELGVANIVLCLDGDKAGQDAVEKILDTRLQGVNDINVKIISLPDEQDPAEFIQSKGIGEFKSLALWSAFEWRLNRFPESADPETICRLMIPLIIGEPSHITQDKMCEVLAKNTGISSKSIRAELGRLQNERDRRIAQERSVVIDKLMRNAKSSPTEVEMFLNDALSQLQELNQKYDQDKLGPESCLKILDDQKNSEEAKTGEFAGFRLGPDLKALEEALEGQWRKDVFMCFGGAANSGKTSLCAKIGYEISRHLDNNACVIYHTIDDTAAQFLGKWICIGEGSKHLTINEVRDPVYYQKLGMTETTIRRTNGYQAIREVMKDGRLILKDSNDGNSLSYADSLIRYYKDRYPDRNIVYILDNLHKLQDFGAGSESERIKFKNISETIKNMATRHHVTIMCTVEYTKLPAGTKPTNNNIAETVQLIYDSNFIAHLYNDVHERGEQVAESAGMTHNAEVGHKVKKLPVVELNIGKNKITEFKNKLFFNFFPASSDFIARNTDEVEQLIEDNKQNEKAEKHQKVGSKQKLWG